MSNVIYVDILLMINLLVNFLMLSAAGLLVKTPTRSWRIFISAAIGAAYSLIIFLPDMNLFFSIALRVICFAVMLFTAFSIRSFKDFLRAGGNSKNKLSRKRDRTRRSHRYRQFAERAVFFISCDSI